MSDVFLRALDFVHFTLWVLIGVTLDVRIAGDAHLEFPIMSMLILCVCASIYYSMRSTFPPSWAIVLSLLSLQLHFAFLSWLWHLGRHALISQLLVLTLVVLTARAR